MFRMLTMSEKIYFSNLDEALKIMYNSNPQLHQHSIRVSRVSKLIAKKLTLTEEKINIISSAALLHDIGKLLLTQTVLDESHQPFFYGSNFIKSHTMLGAKLLSETGFPSEIVETVLSHHEWFNGKGLPRGLKGEEIPLSSRVIYVAEVYDALTDPHREKNMQKNIALKKLKELSGIRFDPEIVEALLEVEKT